MNHATIVAAIRFCELPALGATLMDGTFRGIVTLKDGIHAAVILLPNKAQERMDWDAAMNWAKQAGGQLPTRPVAALLYANAKDQLERTWYWTSDELQADIGDEDDASFAWGCGFFSGNQIFSRKSAGGAAVAVRLIHLTA